MTILFNGLSLNNNPSGVQYYILNLGKELIKEMSGPDECEFLFPKAKDHFALPSGTQNITITSIPFVTNKLRRVLTENVYLPLHYRKDRGYRIIHSPAYILPYFMNLPSILTVHDLIALDYPEFCHAGSAIYFKYFLPRSVKRATRIIAVSNKVKEDIIGHFNVSPDTIDVIYHGIDEKFRKVREPDSLNEIIKKYNLPEQFILFVGNIEPKKNLKRLIEAFCQLKKQTEIKHKLVIVGQNGWKYYPVFEAITRLDISNEVLLTGYVPEDDLPCIYSLADLFVFPSLYEGFGIPPLEAMACETPVLVSNQGALPETTGGKCLQVDPFDINEIATGMHKLLTDDNLRNKSIIDGKEWVKQFSWEKAAKETLSVYKQAIDMIYETNS